MKDDTDAPCRVGIPEILNQARHPALEGALQEFPLSHADTFGTDVILDGESKRGFERLHDTGRAGLLAFLDVGDKVLVFSADVIDRTAGRDRRRQVAPGRSVC
ncbi:MAG: hypothetical protein U5K38_18475 [Woeseiaceae bacterium]|nr:hypothetical protein [Woeseiaceae bacterium]